MNLTSEYTTAENGTAVRSTVSLDLDAVGIDKRPFRVQAGAGLDYLFSGFCKTRAEADRVRARMHAAYTEVHSA